MKTHTDCLIAAMPHDAAPAARLGALLEIETLPVELGRFPDGETKVRAPRAAKTVLLYCSLYDPDPKIFPLTLAASALGDLGAQRIILIAPYLCYMRQDKAFRSGEPVSQKVLAAMLSPWIDHLMTVEPHIHRVESLSAAFPDIGATNVSAAPLLAGLIGDDGPEDNALLVGPDAESAAWTKAVAERTGLPFAVMSKIRRGDRDVEIAFDDDAPLAGRRVYLIDDLVSSGATLAASAKILKARGTGRVEALAVHALADNDAMEALKASGVERLRSLDTIPHGTNAAHAAPLLADALRSEVL